MKRVIISLIYKYVKPFTTVDNKNYGEMIAPYAMVDNMNRDDIQGQDHFVTKK